MDGGLGQVYERMAGEYAAHADDSPHNAHYDRPALLELCGDVTGRRVLDAGCGAGHYAAELVARGAEVVGFDAHPSMVELTRARLGARAQVHQLDLGEPLPFADGSFDVAVCALALHYVDDRAASLGELARVLRPSGALLVSVQHPTSDWLSSGGSYFDVVVETDTWRGTHSEWEVSYWREPLTSLCDAIYRAGLVIERLVEPRPQASMRERSPAHFDRLEREPGFLHLRLLSAPRVA